MRVLVTGAAGFIGSHLCEFLIGHDCDVLGMDNFITGSADNLVPVERQPHFRFARHNVTEYIAVEGPLDWVLHFASPASPADYLELPIQTLKVGALGTHNALGLAKAKRAHFLLASTSEVYGDPLVHPQREEYWGNVNPVGPRGVYDEAKRFAEAMTMAYHRVHGVDTRIVRIFNSLPADEFTIVVDNDELLYRPIGECADVVDRHGGLIERKVMVPAFDVQTFRMSLRPVDAFIKHRCATDVYTVTTRYGRRVRVTGDHSVFRRTREGRPEPVFVKDLRPGDAIAIPARIPVIEKDRTEVSLTAHLLRKPVAELWRYAVASPALAAVVRTRREEIHGWLATSTRFAGRRHRNELTCATNKYLHGSFLPMAVVRALNITVPADARLRMFTAGARVWLADRLAVTDELLWLLGFFLAEGCVQNRGTNCFLTLSSDEHFLDKAERILREQLGLHVGRRAPRATRGPSLTVHSRLLHLLFAEVLGVLADAIPAWILQLPLDRLKWFLDGYREGDGTHSGKKLGNELCFETVSEQRARDLNFILLRFGILASIGRYETTFRKRYGDRRFPFYRLTVCALTNFDVLTWDRGVEQRLNAHRLGDLVWARVRAVERSIATEYVYDFSVPDAENFVGGNGVACHNTFGPRMRLNDGRAIPAFMTQALMNAPLTVFGDGSQTRSFQYISDLVDGVWRLMQAPVNDPVNIGNPHEMTLLELAKRIIRLTGSRSEIVFGPLPVDDPKVRQPDITRAHTLLGWEPRVDTDEGLKRTVEWFRGRVGGRREGVAS